MDEIDKYIENLILKILYDNKGKAMTLEEILKEIRKRTS